MTTYLERFYGARAHRLKDTDAVFAVYAQEPVDGNFALLKICLSYGAAEAFADVLQESLGLVFTIECADSRTASRNDDGELVLDELFCTTLHYNESRLAKLERV